tara:strand:- start:5198 stop:5713 length:516 start_codon:yes stop_codon:yes gene_type:complete
MAELIDAKAYAEHRNVSGAMVTKYLQQGMIPSAQRIGRSWKIDPVLADKELAEVLGEAKPKKKPEKKVELDIQNGHQTGTPSFAANRAIKELYAARIAKLDFEERSKKLVSLSEVKLKLARLHIAVRDNLRSVPDRIAPVVAAETDQSRIHAAILKEIGIALEGLKEYDIG